ncbi:ROK family protein [Leifsonia bigeumensis]|uniref:ROK family protein n=1 Tax=Leifsonella bigeumensis TaxID=433643 RepID=A0ABP7G2X1_9MICO
MVESAAWVLGIDLGGTGCRFVALTPSGEVLARTIVATPVEPDIDVRGFLRRQVERLDRLSSPTAVGIGASGPIDTAGIIRNSDTLAAFTGIPLLAMVQSEFGAPCVIDNDAVAAAVAEARSGAAIGADSLLHVTLGTGVGVCLLQGGEPFRGGDGAHPESGHFSVSGPPAPCYCGREICWEQRASRTALQAAAANAGFAANGDLRDIRIAADAARAGDTAALRVFTDYGAAVGEGLATLLALYRPTTVVIGGGSATFLAEYRDAMMSVVERTSLWHSTFTVRPTELDDFGGAIGGAYLALATLAR